MSGLFVNYSFKVNFFRIILLIQLVFSTSLISFSASALQSIVKKEISKGLEVEDKNHLTNELLSLKKDLKLALQSNNKKRILRSLDLIIHQYGKISELDSCAYYTGMAIRLLDSRNETESDKQQLATYFFNIGDLFTELHENDEAIRAYKLFLKTSKNLKTDVTKIYYSYFYLSNLFNISGQIDSSIYYSTIAYNYSISKKDAFLIANTEKHLSDIYRALNLDKSTKYLKLAFKNFKNSGYKPEELSCCIQLINNYNELGREADAKDQFNLCEDAIESYKYLFTLNKVSNFYFELYIATSATYKQLEQYEEAIKFNKKAIENAKFIPQSKLIKTIQNQGNLCLESAELENIEKLFQNNFDYISDDQDSVKAVLLRYMTEIYYRLGKLDKAIEACNNSLNLLKSNVQIDEELQNVFALKCQIHEANLEFDSAYHYFLLKVKKGDLLRDANSTKLINGLDEKFSKSKELNEINTLEYESLKKKLFEEKSTLWLYVTISFGALGITVS